MKIPITNSRAVILIPMASFHHQMTSGVFEWLHLTLYASFHGASHSNFCYRIQMLSIWSTIKLSVESNVSKRLWTTNPPTNPQSSSNHIHWICQLWPNQICPPRSDPTAFDSNTLSNEFNAICGIQCCRTTVTNYSRTHAEI